MKWTKHFFGQSQPQSLWVHVPENKVQQEDHSLESQDLGFSSSAAFSFS